MKKLVLNASVPSACHRERRPQGGQVFIHVSVMDSDSRRKQSLELNSCEAAAAPRECKRQERYFLLVTVMQSDRPLSL